VSNYTAFIPLRGGSKSIPRKNIKNIAGYPLFYWSVKAAIDSKCFDNIVISSEDDEILLIANKFFEDLIVLDKRPDKLAQDTTSTEDVVIEYLGRNTQVDNLVLIQATSPLTSKWDFIKAKEKYVNEKLDSLLTGCEFKRFIWTSSGEPKNYDPHNRPRRQDFEGDIIENGAFYFSKRSVYEKYNNRLGGKIGIHIMHEDTSFEIDEPSDWTIVEMLLKKHNEISLKEKLKNIKAIVLDVDGTLTDGGMYYSAEGEELKKFNTKDAKGIELAKKAGYEVCIITAEDSPRVHSRMKKMQISEENYFFGIKDKLPVLKKWCESKNIELNQVAYGGDDLGDLECMHYVGFSFCPCDAVYTVLSDSDYITISRAGYGAVREFCNFLLSSKIDK